MDLEELGEQTLLREVVDYVLPVIPPYELSVYLLLLRLSHLDAGAASVRIGKRSIVQAMGRGQRSATGNYQHITEKLQALAGFGFIEIGDTNRFGTAYAVRLPSEVPMVRERIAQSGSPSLPGDFYRDPELRLSLFERDEWQCRYCGERLTTETATLDHMIPSSRGGGDGADNLATSCMMCNAIKSGRTYEEAAPQILARIRDTRSN